MASDKRKRKAREWTMITCPETGATWPEYHADLLADLREMYPTKTFEVVVVREVLPKKVRRGKR